MPGNQTELYNVACAVLGIEGVQAYNESSDQAIAFNRVWGPVRRRVLADHPWNGCIKIKTLTAYSTDPIDGSDWEKQFELPSDLLRVLSLNGKDNEPGSYAWEIGNHPDTNKRILLTDENTATIKYIADIDDVSLFEPALFTAVAHELARTVKKQFDLGTGEQQLIVQEALNELGEAKAVDGTEGSPLFFTDTSLVDARE